MYGFGMRINSAIILMSLGVELHVTILFVWFLETVSLCFGWRVKPLSPIGKGEGYEQVSRRWWGALPLSSSRPTVLT